MPELRKCLYHENKYLFHGWFQEGGFERRMDVLEGEIGVGAILENPYNGKVKKAWDIERIQFEEELNDE